MLYEEVLLLINKVNKLNIYFKFIVKNERKVLILVYMVIYIGIIIYYVVFFLK